MLSAAGWDGLRGRFGAFVFVSRQLGHANPAITLNVYTHLFDAARHAREAREQLEAEYGAMILRDRNAR